MWAMKAIWREMLGVMGDRAVVCKRCYVCGDTGKKSCMWGILGKWGVWGNVLNVEYIDNFGNV